MRMEEDILHLRNSSNMFEKVFPFLLEYLSREEIFGCRSVCKHWCYGVDRFLESSILPPAPYEESIPFEYDTNYISLNVFRGVLEKKKLLGPSISEPEQRAKMLLEASDHPRCPIIDRSFCSYESQHQSTPTNVQFLKVFGKYILYLQVILDDLSMIEALKRIIELLVHVPNLQRLQVLGDISGTNGEGLDADLTVSNFVQVLKTCGIMSRLPRVLALEVRLENSRSPFDKHFNECLLEILYDVSMQKLEFSPVANIHNREFKNLVELHLTITCDGDLSQLRSINSPVRRLSLTLEQNVAAQVFLETIGHFRNTIRNLEVSVEKAFYDVTGTAGRWETLPSEMQPFGDRDGLAIIPNLKRVSWDGYPPPSLNFLCGLSYGLEYLRFSFEELSSWKDLIGQVGERMGVSEELDIFDCMRRFEEEGSQIMYDSNVWGAFPKLRVMGVYWRREDYWESGEYEFRRDIYAKIISSKA